ncbi:MAG: hypothetical protein A3D31_03245 [Candidatus Fluviicola riflensis]|nr:MAG: hypothetical protein CHH17_11785 [Candidatus Fluviicola riflensis]OGS78999.1 MAG: hypothetical protein A3D31_03245 [Candidatus Fluviicola riflensis]OGS86022.1 MAG: hypothetical protein A3E30_10735 [Fluviicola sp. RIFCSPHIGHO2_12_FULL_43_24]OGS86431.1 MAG: hypothetical protein A2724_02705 [Fluviicola sp. RIFCSPHIGHO2_01_FULL_43_53]
MKQRLYLLLIGLLSLNAFGQFSVHVRSSLDSSAVFGVVCSNEKTNQLAFTDQDGLAKFTSVGTIQFTHPSFYSATVFDIETDTIVYIQPLIGDLEEIIITPVSNEAVFASVIANYRKQLKLQNSWGKLTYTNTNWFKYHYKTDQTTDSAYCAIRDNLRFAYNGTARKSKPLFSGILLNRTCSDFTLEKNASIRTNEIPAFSKFDFSLFLDAVFTEDSFFDKIGFKHTGSAQRQDTLNHTTEITFTSPDCVKTIVFSTEDKSLISYTFRFFGKLGGYHYYYATFSDQLISTLFEEKGYLFDYETNSHQLISVHYGSFETTEKTILANPMSFSEILKTQATANNGDAVKTEVLLPMYGHLLK